jgi:hypothetical protein
MNIHEALFSYAAASGLERCLRLPVLNLGTSVPGETTMDIKG